MSRNQNILSLHDVKTQEMTIVDLYIYTHAGLCTFTLLILKNRYSEKCNFVFSLYGSVWEKYFPLHDFMEHGLM